MGMKLPIAATSIVCSACVAVSVAAPTVDLPEKSRQVEAARSVTQEYKLVAVTDPITGAVTLFALSLADLGKINKFFADNLLSPLFTLASSPLNIPTQVSNQVPLETAIQNNITVPIQKLQAFPAGLVALIQDIFGGTSMMAASGPNVALAAAPTPGLDALVSPLADLGQVNKFFADNLLSPLFTLGSSPLNIPTQLSNQKSVDEVIKANITDPIDKLEGFPAGLADLVRDILGGATGFAAAGSEKLAIPSITGAPGIITKATTNAGTGKTDPTLGSSSSITDLPGFASGDDAPQRKTPPRFVNLRTHSEDPTDTGQGGRHRLENISRSLRFTPPSRKLHEKTESTSTGNPAASNPEGPNPSDPPNNEK